MKKAQAALLAFGLFIGVGVSFASDHFGEIT
jgi:hypothetical protein